MKEISAGIIAYHFDKDTKQFKFLVAHPGGPYFKNIKKYGFPKGHQEKNESLKETAIREFKEETGLEIEDLYRKYHKKEEYLLLSIPYERNLGYIKDVF